MSPSSSKAVRPKPQRSGSSFSSFIRKITGRTAPLSDTETSQAVIHAPSTGSQSIEQGPKPVLPTLDTNPPNGSAPPPASSPAAEPIQEHSPPPQIPLPALPVEVEPHAIPMPPSPLASKLPEPQLDTAADFAVLAPSIVVSGPSLKKVKQSGMLSLEGFDIYEEDETTAQGEKDDIVKPLASSIIPSLSESGNESLAISMIRSTTSGKTESPSLKTEGASPVTDRAAMVSAAGNPSSGLGRKESRLRKSMMGLAEVITLRHIGQVHRS